MKTKLNLIIALLLVTTIAADAQKLPSVQTTAFRAPKNVKVDGKTMEWDDTFQAHNTAVDLYYIIANDDDNLYITARATEQEGINRVANGGLSLVIYKSGKKTNKDKITVTYPLHSEGNSMYFNFRGRKNSVPDTTYHTADSLMKISNRKLDQNVKFVSVEGIAGIDSIISIYNDNGIKVAGRFDIKKAYTLEMAIPLKILGLSADNGIKFTYQLRVNGRGKGGAGGIVLGELHNMDGSLATGEMAEKFNAGAARVAAQMNADTDCWGEYTLAKK